MTRVLLITDTERVQRVFGSLEAQGILQLRTSATLTLGEAELSAFAPDVVFLQSRISGFSSQLALPHLQRSLTGQSRLLLLAVDADDAAQAKKQGLSSLDLALDDDVLEEAVKRELSGGAPTPKVAGKGAPAAAAPVAAKKPSRRRAAPAAGAGPESAAAPAVTGPVAALPTEKPERPGSKGKKETKPRPGAEAKAPAKGGPREETPPSAAEAPGGKELAFAGEQAAGLAGHAGFESAFSKHPVQAPQQPAEPHAEEPALGVVEQPREATAEPAPEAAAALAATPAAQERPEERSAQLPAYGAEKGGAESFAEMMTRFADQEPPQLSPPLQVEDRVSVGAPVAAPAESAGEPEEGAFRGRTIDSFEGETLADAMLRARHRKKHPAWVIPLALVLIFVPLVYFVAIRQAVGPRQAPRPSVPAPPAAPLPKSHPAPTAAATPAQPKSGPAPAAKPAAPAATAPVKRPAPLAARQPAKPVEKGGLQAIPPFMAGARLDPAYGKTHHGWERYLGAQAEYKLFREGGRYRAIQVIALDGRSISDQLYRNVLLQFGGIDSYRLQSSEEKGSFVIEQGVAGGGVGLTIYRKKKDLSMKGLVLYFR